MHRPLKSSFSAFTFGFLESCMSWKTGNLFFGFIFALALLLWLFPRSSFITLLCELFPKKELYNCRKSIKQS